MRLCCFCADKKGGKAAFFQNALFYDRSAAINYLVSSLLTLTDYRYAPHNPACPDFDELLYYLNWYCKTFNYDPMDHTVIIPLKKEAENNYAKDL